MGNRVDVLSSEGQPQGTVELPDELFAVEISEYALYRAVVTYEANQRQGTAAAKGRSDVSRTGKKHHRQKGTGWARRGSLRSPLVRGGGVAFGPQPRSYRSRMSKSLRRLALGSALTLKAQDGLVRVVEDLGFDKPSTKGFLKAMAGWGVEGTNKVLFVAGESDPVVYRSCRNIPAVRMIPVGSLGTHDVVAADIVVFARKAFGALSGHAGEGTAGPRSTEE